MTNKQTLTVTKIHETLLAEINNRIEQAITESHRPEIQTWLVEQAETLADSFRVLTDGESDQFTRILNMKMHAELTAAATVSNT